jgi:protein O-GlcNAc transferase
MSEPTPSSDPLSQVPQVDPGLAELRARLQANPNDARLYFELGNLLLERGQAPDALPAFERAATLAPKVAAAHFGLGGVCYTLGHFDAAADAYRRAMELDADAPTANNLGNALARAERFEEAADAYRTAIDEAPEQAGYRLNLARSLRRLGKLSEAAGEYAQAANLEPGLPQTFHDLGELNFTRGRLTEAQFCFAKALEIDPQSAVTHCRLVHALQFDPNVGSEQLDRESRFWAQSYTNQITMLPPRRGVNPERRLRIGYLAGEQFAQRLGRLIAPLLARHDRAQFDVYVYSDALEKTDAVRQANIAELVWRSSARMSDEALAGLIREDAIDVLIDLTGHAGNRLLTVAYRPAPVHAAWLGYPGTTGLRQVDRLLADEDCLADGEERYYAEQIERLPGGFVCFAPPTGTPDVNPLPMQSRGGPTFGAFCELANTGPSVVGVWSTLLTNLPRATLLLRTAALSDAGVRAAVTQQFAECGIEAGRLRLEGTNERDPPLTAFHEVDVLLDPFPYDGGLATFDALWMGVPVVHRQGARFAGRVSESLLRRAGLADWIAPSNEAYLERAAAAVADVEQAAALRSGLRAQVAASPLCGADAFIRRLEGVYRTMWREGCAAPR